MFKIDLKEESLLSNILWINLKNSVERRNNMMNQLNFIPIKDTRIEAIIPETNLFLNTDLRLTPPELSCLSSHFKALELVKELEGEYFMICEDDVVFENETMGILNSIIKNMPQDTELLRIHSWNPLNSHKDFYVKYTDKPTVSMACYIVKKNINLEKLFSKYETKYKIENTDEYCPADLYIPKKLNTYTFKYNLISTLDKDSTIHSSHLKFHRIMNAFSKIKYLEFLQTL
jgi:GR25 family glycosyltransferase involved in LPS biosynthesis